jgi:CubicO group peptidase (beta-lactamase class C family)
MPVELEGVDPGRLVDLVDRARREVEDGPLPSCQLAVARHGRLVTQETIGAPEDSRYVVFSTTKALMAGAVWLLFGDGLLAPTDHVVDHLPGFGTNGKDTITVDHLLLHEAGIPHAPLGPPEWDTRETRRARFADWRLNWDPGTRVEYHPTSAHWVLAELIDAVTGLDHRRFVGERLLDPLGLERLRLGVPAEDQADIVDAVTVGSPPSPEELEAATGIRGIDLAGMGPAEIGEGSLLRFNEPAVRALGVPGAGAVSDAADMALFLQAMLHDPGGLWDPEVLADGTGTVHTVLEDTMLGIPANRSRGLLIAGDDGNALRRGMGRTTSPRAFGHHGAGGQIAWADPVSGLSFCFLTNGLDADPLDEGRRRAALSNRAGALAD